MNSQCFRILHLSQIVLGHIRQRLAANSARFLVPLLLHGMQKPGFDTLQPYSVNKLVPGAACRRPRSTTPLWARSEGHDRIEADLMEIVVVAEQTHARKHVRHYVTVSHATCCCCQRSCCHGLIPDKHQQGCDGIFLQGTVTREPLQGVD